MERIQKHQHDEMVKKILSALESLEYGMVLITVHDSKITQIEKTEKIRFPMERRTKP